MSDTIIAVENLSKRYLVGHQSAERERYTALRDVIGREVRNFSRKAVDFIRGRQIVQGDDIEEFWALRDVSFEVKQGEVLGIIGGNGAGKSTLLKILSRITEPTKGKVRLRGRVGSLLEVGTGFHPELTGRENIILNGAILGMKTAEIKSKFDEIVAFADVERFLDTPVKRYSSGMYVRLAFSIAAHLEPEILIVDEVLAVGDVEFQRKCLGKMQDVASNQGRTILFVSHNMAAIESMCSSALLLVEGRCAAQGNTPAIVQEYLRDMSRISKKPISERTDRSGSGEIRFTSLSLEGLNGAHVSALRCGDEGVLHLKIENRTGQEIRSFRIAIGIDNELGQRVTHLDTGLQGSDVNALPPGFGNVRVVLPRIALVPGRYRLTLFSTANGGVADWIRDAVSFDVEAGDYYGTGQLPLPNQGVFLAEHHFVLTSKSVETEIQAISPLEPLAG
jgi:homopolymeric O-antigen transport system ATP-binding protein